MYMHIYRPRPMILVYMHTELTMHIYLCYIDGHNKKYLTYVRRNNL